MLRTKAQWMDIIQDLKVHECMGGNRSDFIRKYNAENEKPINYAALTSAMFRYKDCRPEEREGMLLVEWDDGYAFIPRSEVRAVHKQIEQILRQKSTEVSADA